MPILRPCRTKLPKALIQRMVRAGAVQEGVEGEDLCLIRIVDGIGSPSWLLYQEWVSGLGEVDPLVTAVFFPSNEIMGTAFVPNVALVGQLMIEANSIITHYAPLEIQDFAAGAPIIPGPIAGVQAPIPIHHAKVSVCGLIACIQDPPATYPTINGLGTGSYICDIMYQWTAAAIRVPVFKPQA